MQERQCEWITPQSLHLPGPDSPPSASVAVHIGMKSLKGDVDTPWSTGTLICLHEDALEPADDDDMEAALGGDVIADPDVHAFIASDRLSWRDDGLEVPDRCHAELKEFQQSFMGGNFVLCRIAQDAFDPVALTDEVDESGVSALKCHCRRSKNCGNCAMLMAMTRASSSVRTFAWMASSSVVRLGT